MQIHGLLRGVVLGLVPLLAMPATPGAQTTEGRRILANDGDTIVVEGESTVRIVRRRPGIVRTIFNPAQGWLLVLADYPPRGASVPDGLTDVYYYFRDITGSWPLAERWEGEAVVDEYRAPEGPANSIGLQTPFGLVQLLGGPPLLGATGLFTEPDAIAVLHAPRAGWGVGGRLPLDAAEQQQVAALLRNEELRPLAGPRVSVGLAAVQDVAASDAASPPHPGHAHEAAAGGGSSVRSPRRLHDVAPALPEAARQAGIRGTVILALTIGTDGTVTGARVLRSIPLLDQAALDAARQWRYEPVVLNGKPVPVILTAGVSFE